MTIETAHSESHPVPEGPPERCDALVIGGGPAGSTVATVLARAGRRVIVAERERFPRFHIGESLLPASVPIFDRLGVHDQIRREFVHKPGGKWFYGDRPLLGDFKLTDPDCSFGRHTYSYMVERSRFDEILLTNAAHAGAEVRYETDVRDVAVDPTGRVTGATLHPKGGAPRAVQCEMVFDCSGQRGLLATRFRIRRPTSIKRIALFAHYRARRVDPHLKDGWFVGYMLPDGWTWMIPLGEELVSVGIVIPTERLRAAEQDPEGYLDRALRSVPTFERGITPDSTRVTDVRVMRNMGYTTDRFYGDGWTLVGDAAFFIDPCWSSGVHMAMMSGEKAARAFLDSPLGDRSRFALYQTEMQKHERGATRMVESFYMATRSRPLRWLIPRIMNRYTQPKFGSFVSGDFSKNLVFVHGGYWLSRAIHGLSSRMPTARTHAHSEAVTTAP